MKRVILLALLLTACATATTEKYTAKLRTWKGSSSIALVKSWGVPTNVMALTDGTKAYEYVWNGGARGVATVTGADAYNVYCKTTFFLGTDDKVTEARWEGNACRSDD